MDENTGQRHSYFFTVRIWTENHDGGMEWRGKAQYIPSGETCYFRDWVFLLAFLKKRMPEGARGLEDGQGRAKVSRFKSGLPRRRLRR